MVSINHLLDSGEIPVSCVTFKGGRFRVGKLCYKEWRANAISRVALLLISFLSFRSCVLA